VEYFIRFVDETSVEFVEPRLIGHRFETRNKGDGSAAVRICKRPARDMLTE